MEKNWLIIILIIVAAVAVIIFLVWRNQKDEKDVMKSFIDEDEVSIPKEHDTEVDQTED
jgi:preprotein translocase subunit YajC